MKTLKKLKEHYQLVIFFIGVVVAFCTTYIKISSQYDEILNQLRTNQQMSLKSVIWSDSIPISDRVSACDTYIKAGYNSITKKHCNQILEESEV